MKIPAITADIAAYTSQPTDPAGRPFLQAQPIDKGWSGDQKFCATAADGTKYLLRITPHERSESREDMFRMQETAAALDIPMCRPVKFGACGDGVYVLQTWIDGDDARDALPEMPIAQQYAYGLAAGQILQKIHAIPAPDDQPDWEQRFNTKIDRKIARYGECPLKYQNDKPILAYIEANRHLLRGRPQCFQHGDYHIGNMMIDRDGTLQIIDFDRYDFGDPWEEFNRIVWDAQEAPAFAAGRVDGYFDGQVPDEFWSLLALYIASNTLSSLPWAIPFGQREIDTMRRQAAEMLAWYDDMKQTVPTWYIQAKKQLQKET
jgi:aminoglycoside phosphotransferase (APT) family kinase protein